MTFQIWDGSSWRNPTFVRRWDGSAWVDVGQASKWNGSAWEQVWPLIVIQITDQLIADANPSGNAGYSLLSSGQAQRANGTSGTTNITGEWKTGGGAGGDYEARATLNSGALASGSSATGTWLSLASGRTWFCDSVNTAANLTVEIRNATTLTVLDSANIDLQVGI